MSQAGFFGTGGGGGGGGGGTIYHVTTIDATETAIAPILVPIDSAITVYALVSGALADYSEAIWSTVTYGARRSGAGLIAIDMPASSFATDAIPNTLASARVNGNNIEITVTGQPGQIWNWSALVFHVTQSI